jgi:hypothetical protein
VTKDNSRQYVEKRFPMYSVHCRNCHENLGYSESKYVGGMLCIDCFNIPKTKDNSCYECKKGNHFRCRYALDGTQCDCNQNAHRPTLGNDC